MERKRFGVEWQQKAEGSEGRRFEGWASTEQLDFDGDVVRASAFRETLPRFLANPVLLWQHDWKTPIGKIVRAEIEEGRGLYIEAELSDTSAGRDAQILLSDGVIRDLSIGFFAREYTPLERGREITQLDLYEISLVTVGANATAEITQLKRQGRTPICPPYSLSGDVLAKRIKLLEDRYDH